MPTPTPGITIEQAARLISHPLRTRILHAIVEADAVDGVSPSDLAARWKEPIGNVSYHARILAKHRVIRQTRVGQVRGAVEHYYAGTHQGERVLALRDAWEQA